MEMMIRDRWRCRHLKGLVPFGLIFLFLVGCGSAASTSTPSSTAALPASGTPNTEKPRTITLGNIDPDEPSRKIKEFQPLADYLAQQLKGFGIKEGRVVIARDIAEMAHLIRNGNVDIYFDAPIPALAVCELAGCEVGLQQWRRGQPMFYGVYVARRDGGVERIEDLVGKVIAFQKPRSTVGFALPAATIVQRGFSLSKVSHPDSAVPANTIGYLIAGGERSTVELLLSGRIAAAAFGDLTYEELPPEIKGQLIVFDRTVEAPNQLTTVRPGLETDLVRQIYERLVSLDELEQGRPILEALRETEKFEPLPPESEVLLAELKALGKFAPKE